MNEDSIEKAVIECFAECFNLQNDNIDPDASLNEFYGVDSIDIIEFVVMLENKFKFTFDDEDLSDSKLRDIKSIVNSIRRSIGDDSND